MPNILYRGSSKGFLFLLMASLIGGSEYKHANDQPATIASVLDADLENLRFESLDRTLKSMAPGVEKDYFSGVLANRSGRISESLNLLEQTLAALKTTNRPRAAITLQTLADDYLKCYRYADAAKAYNELLNNFAGDLSKSDLESVKDDAGVIRLLIDYPPQAVSMTKSVQLRTKRSRIGTIDSDLTINDVTSEWILDTGASFSVVTTSFAKRLGVQPSIGVAQVKGTVTGANNVVHVGLLPKLDIGGAVVQNVVLLILDDKSLLLDLGSGQSYQINAILGFPIFENLGSATFSKSGEFTAGALPERSRPTAKMFMKQLKPLIECSVAQQTLLFAFDTGADVSTLSTRYYHDFEGEFKGLEKVPSNYGGAGGTSKSEVFVLPQLDMRVAGEAVLLKHLMTFPFKVGTEADDSYGNLGRDLVAGFDSFTLDFHRMTFSLGDRSVK